jgi:hypothetical protein
MIAVLLAAAASLPTAIDAERAFAADAQRIGQWSAFRKYADPDAVLFTPQAIWARDFLKDRKDPAASVRWWPARSFVSCDRRTAVNDGPAINPAGKHYGTFTTVWQRDAQKWAWVYDNGTAPKAGANRRRAPRVSRASCKGKPPGAPVIPPPALTTKQARTTPEDSGRGHSADKTLGWDWRVEKNGEHHFRVYLWNGTRYAQVIYNNVPGK